MTQLETTTPDDFDTWLAGRPAWLQTAAARLLKDGRPDATAMEILADLCHDETKKTPSLITESLPVGAFAKPAAPLNMHINKITGVTGLNAIRAGAELSFEDSNLTIIFGTNGVGKTGFSRLLKHACGARKKADLLPNVFAASSPAPTAQFELTRDGTPEPHAWTLGDPPLKSLRYVHVFDSNTAAEYVNAKNEASYETRRLRFISALIEISDKVGALLAARQEKLVSRLPALPADLAISPAATFLHGLRAKTSPASIEAACAFTPEDQERRLTLETTLAETNIEAKLQIVRQNIKLLGTVDTSLATFTNSFSVENLALLVRAQLDYNTKRKAATDAVQKAFANAPLEGIGEDSWRLMWEQARLYSQQHAYNLKPFPVVSEEANCVLCQQPLSDEAKTRLSSFEDFVRGALETQARNAEDAYITLLRSFPKMPEPEEWRTLLLPLKLDDTAIDSNYAELLAIHQQLSIVLPQEPMRVLQWTSLDEAIATAKAEAAKQEQALLDSQDLDKRTLMAKQLLELKGREWLSQQKAHIEHEVARLAAISTLQEAAKTTKTTQLTNKKNELITSELADGYQRRFSEELKLLGGDEIPVEPTAFPEGKGKVSFQLTLKGAIRKERAQDILSEGENRIVALAAFVADMRGLGFPTPFVFDDPISSLDQDFEERVVERLIDLAKTRQVIVFTHRLSLVTLLEEAQKTAGLPPPRLETLRRLGQNIGIKSKADARHKKPDAGFNILKESLIALRKYETNGDVVPYEAGMKAACTDFRILVEKTVESVLLNDVVVRFRRAVHTQNKLGNLHKITAPDCDFLDAMMTKCSRPVHSQSDELPAKLPSINDFEADIVAMVTWIKTFNAR